jgi:hypothetical protein
VAAYHSLGVTRRVREAARTFRLLASLASRKKRKRDRQQRYDRENSLKTTHANTLTHRAQ